MQAVIQKYIEKLNAQGLADKDKAIFLALDAELFSNKPVIGDVLKLSKIFALMNINTILFSEPSEPYRAIINELASGQWSSFQAPDRIVPMDCETRTFFHDIPVIGDFSAKAIAKALSLRKSAIIRNRGIVTYGVVTPEQAFVSFSSTCFSTFVKYFFDSLMYFEKCYNSKITPDKEFIQNFDKIAGYIKEKMVDNLPVPTLERENLSSPFSVTGKKRRFDEDRIIKILSEAGRAVVEHRLVDSYFGNISYVFDNKIYISQTGSSMDELQCCIDAVPLDGSSSVGITASSELSAHKNIYYETGDNAILHGHPKFSVIMSMFCEEKDCEYYLSRHLCHKSCKEKRYISGVPVVSGEIGTGPTGLMNTVAPAMKEGKGVIVYGHGVFTSGRDGFQKPFDMLKDIESRCREEYFRKINKYLNPSSSPQS
jgi:ribulose-5-phosphate 4-epimerase/fuculose-1-phosphate aldolase